MSAVTPEKRRWGGRGFSFFFLVYRAIYLFLNRTKN